MNALPHVKDFVVNHVPRYNGKVEVEYVHGKDPEVSFYSKRGGKVLQKSRIDHMTIQQILKFMKYKGFQKE